MMRYVNHLIDWKGKTMTTKPTLEMAREYGIEVLDYEEVSNEDYATKIVKEYIKKENKRWKDYC